MTAVIIIGVIILLIIIFNSGGSSTKTPTETEQQRQARLQREREQAEELRQANLRREKERAEQERQATLLRQTQQAEQQRQATLRREREQAEQQRQATLQRQRQQAEQQQQLQNRQAEEALELQLCETNTAYKNSLHSLYTTQGRSFSFNSIRSISVPVINQLPEPIKNKLHRELNSGVTILMTENHLHSYHFAFGNMHQAKLKEALQVCHSQNHLNLQGQEIEIIDYGCGQGIGTVVFVDFLKSNNISCTIKKVKLIEPSTLAIKRASLNVRYSLRSINQNENVFAINKTLDNINELHLTTTDNTIKIHLLSNIIDVEGFQLNGLCRKISSTQKGKNIFVCVSPRFWQDGVHSRNLRLDNFLSHFQQNHQTTSISQRDTDIGTWKRYERVFSVNIPVLNGGNNNLNLRTARHIADDDLPF